MSLAPSPLQDITSLVGRRHLVRIPKDQQKLLDETTSWAVDLRDEPQGLVHVPSHVLETLQDAYLAKRDSENRDDESVSGSSHGSPTGSQMHDDVPKSPLIAKSSPARPERSSPARPERSSPASPSVSWCTSPDRTIIQHQPIGGSSMVCETPADVAPPPCPSPLPQPAPGFSFPSSDNDNEEDLEIELPQAQFQTDASLDQDAAHVLPRSASPMICSQPKNTPPCAQPVRSSRSPQLPDGGSPQPIIPMTGQRRSPSPEHLTAPEHRQRRMKLIQFSPANHMPAKRTTVPASLTGRMPFTKNLPAMESSNSTSASMIPQSQTQNMLLPSATLIETQTQNRGALNMPMEQHGHSDDEESRSDGERDHSDDEKSHTDDDQSHSENERSRHGGDPIVLVSQATQTRESPAAENVRTSVVISADSELDPFSAFVTVYPEYTAKYAGNLWNFVMACVSLQFIQRERLLAGLLYDDFIRTYASGYLPYCRNAGPGQEALSSVEWFNMTLKESLFTHKLVTMQNLEFILESYPVQVSKAKRIVKGDIQGDIDKHSPVTLKRPMNTDQQSENSPASTKKQKPISLDGSIDVENPAQSPAPASNVVSQKRRYFTQPPAPPSPQLGMQSTVAESSAPQPTAFTPAARSRKSWSSLHLDRPSSSRRSSSGRAAGDPEARIAQLRRFMKRKRESAGSASVASSNAGSDSRGQ